jgi:hypothetical protein
MLLCSLVLTCVNLWWILCTSRLTNKCTELYSSLVFFYFLRWLLHVSAKQCQHQGATTFLSEPLHQQYGRRQVMERMVEPMYWRVEVAEKGTVTV